MGVVARQSLKGSVVTYIGAAIGFFVQFFVITKYLDPGVIGLTKVFYEVGVFFAGFAMLGATASAARYFPYFRDASRKHNGFFLYYISLPAIGTVLVAVAYILLKNPVTSFFAGDSGLFGQFYYYVLPLIGILAFWQILENWSTLNFKIVFSKGVREIYLRLALLCCYLLYAFKVISLSHLMLALLLVYGSCLALMAAYVSRTTVISLKYDSSAVTPELRQNFFRYTAFLLLSTVTGGIMNQLDLFMLSSVKGLYSAGVYTISLYIAGVIEMPARSISTISSPLASDAMKRGDVQEANSLYRKVSVHQLLVCGLVMVLVWSNIDNIFAVLPNGEVFAEGKYVVLFLGLSKLCSVTLAFGSTLIQYSKYYFYTLLFSLTVTLLTIGTNLYFIPKMGVSGAALATLIATICSLAYQQFIVQRKIHGNPFTVKTALAALVLAATYAVNLLIPSLSGVSPWLDIAVRTPVLAAVGGLLAYLLKVSDEINSAVDRFLKRRPC